MKKLVNKEGILRISQVRDGSKERLKHSTLEESKLVKFKDI